MAHGGQLGDQVHGDLRAEDRGGPGEPGRVDAESLQAGDETAAAGRAVQGAQLGGLRLDGFELTVLDLGEEFHGLVRVAAGDGPDLAAERGVGVRAEGGAGEARGRVRRQRAQVGDRSARRRGDRVEIPGAVAADLAGAAGHHDQHGEVVEAFGEGGEPAQGLLIGPVGVVDQQHERPVPPGQPAHRGDQTVTHALRVGLPVAGVRDAEGGAGDVVPVAEVLARLLRHQRHQCGLEQLSYDIEGDGFQRLATAGGPHRAAAPFGDAAGLGQQRGLAEPGLAPEHQQAARGRAVRVQGADRLLDGGDLLVALPQGRRGGRRGPYLRHPATSPSRPNDVPNPSVALRSSRCGPVRGAVAVTGDSEGPRATRTACDLLL